MGDYGPNFLMEMEENLHGSQPNLPSPTALNDNFVEPLTHRSPEVGAASARVGRFDGARASVELDGKSIW